MGIARGNHSHQEKEGTGGRKDDQARPGAYHPDFCHTALTPAVLLPEAPGKHPRCEDIEKAPFRHEYYGYFALLSNEIKDPLDALAIYRNKDMVEKAFENLKERLNVRRLAVSSEQSLDGKLFVQFIALIFLSHITRKMQESNLFKDYTLQEVLDELDVIECFEVPGQRLMVGEMTQRQVELYTKLGVMAPASLQ